jgi:tight adherence protein C
VPQPLFSNALLAQIASFMAFATFLIGGALLIVASTRGRAQAISRRIKLARPSKFSAGPTAAAPTLEEHKFEETLSLTVPEQRQIARFFEPYKVEPDRAVAIFTILRFAAMFGLAAMTYLAFSRASWPQPLLLPLVAALSGWFITIVPVRIGVKKHRTAVAAGLPDAIELMAICADAGISLEKGLHRVSEELGPSQPALANELALTWAQISILPDRDQALMDLADRVDLPSLRWIATTLSQSMRFGTPLAKSLRVAASEMRNDRLMQMEEQANRLPALLTFPVMLLIMPTIFLIVGGPAVLRIIDTFKQTNVGQ